LDNTGTTLALTAATGSWNIAGGTIKGGTVTAAGGAALNISNATLEAVTLGSDLAVGASGSLTLKDGLTLSNSAKLILNGNATASFNGTQSLAGAGEVVLGGSANATNYVYAFGNGTQAGAATLTIAPGILVHGTQNGQVRGYYQFDAILNQGTINSETASRTLTLGGASVSNGGSLQALNGGNLTVNNFSPNTGVLKAGAGSGVTVNGNFVNTGAGTVSVEIGGTGASQFGRLNIPGTATLAGNLSLAVVNGFSPAIGNSFQVMTFGSRTGQFDVITGLAIGNGNRFNPAYAATNLILNVIAAGGAGGAIALHPGTDADSDGDGSPDAQELLAGTDPNDAASIFRITAIQRTAAGLEFTFNAVPGKSYRLEFSHDPGNESWTALGERAGGNARLLKLTDITPRSDARLFYRIAVVEAGK